jgi:hypothetical protein
MMPPDRIRMPSLYTITHNTVTITHYISYCDRMRMRSHQRRRKRRARGKRARARTVASGGKQGQRARRGRRR